MIDLENCIVLGCEYSHGASSQQSAELHECLKGTAREDAEPHNCEFPEHGDFSFIGKVTVLHPITPDFSYIKGGVHSPCCRTS